MNRKIAYTAAATACLIGGAVLAVPFLSTQERVAPAQTEGYATALVPAPHRAGPIQVHVWYPTEAEAAPDVIGQTALFNGFHAQRGAVPELEAAPVLILSHGSGGNAAQMGWLATALAAEGMIVVAPNHPGTMSRDSDPHQTPMIWQRTRDLTSLLDALEAGELAGLTADMTQVSALGFSLGGAAVLSLAGAELSKADFISYCAAGIEAMDCDWMTEGGVDFAGIDAGLYEANHADPRVARVIAVEPALTQAMTQASVAAMDLPVLTFGLSAAGAVPRAVDAAHLVDVFPAAAHLNIDGGYHFSFLPECSALGRIVIGLAGDDNICSDRGYKPRAQVQRELLDVIPGFLMPELAEALADTPS